MNIQDYWMQTQRVYGLGATQILYDEAGTDRIVYIGFAPKAVATSQELWWINKITYSASGNPASETTAPFPSKWDNRASLTYT